MSPELLGRRLPSHQETKEEKEGSCSHVGLAEGNQRDTRMFARSAMSCHITFTTVRLYDCTKYLTSSGSDQY